MAEGYRYVWLGLLILTVIALSFLIERVLPFEEDWNRAHCDVRKDVAHGVVYEIAYVLTLGTLVLISLKLPRWNLWPQWLPIAVQFLLAVLIADCVMTLIHYFSHRVGWLWKFHSIHPVSSASTDSMALLGTRCIRLWTSPSERFPWCWQACRSLSPPASASPSWCSSSCSMRTWITGWDLRRSCLPSVRCIDCTT